MCNFVLRMISFSISFLALVFKYFYFLRFSNLYFISPSVTLSALWTNSFSSQFPVFYFGCLLFIIHISFFVSVYVLFYCCFSRVALLFHRPKPYCRNHVQWCVAEHQHNCQAHQSKAAASLSCTVGKWTFRIHHRPLSAHDQVQVCRHAKQTRNHHSSHLGVPFFPAHIHFILSIHSRLLTLHSPITVSLSVLFSYYKNTILFIYISLSLFVFICNTFSHHKILCIIHAFFNFFILLFSSFASWIFISFKYHVLSAHWCPRLSTILLFFVVLKKCFLFAISPLFTSCFPLFLIPSICIVSTIVT